MRLLLDEEFLSWGEAWEICVGTFGAYKNSLWLAVTSELTSFLLPRIARFPNP